ncbi:hypothetical protein JT27_03935 [Alcaligenes faecalis]|nr:hypothetical protein JT27_03935 [Alcaligenes faecalis]
MACSNVPRREIVTTSIWEDILVAVASAARLTLCNHQDIAVCPLDAKRLQFMTYLLRYEFLTSVSAVDFTECMHNQQSFEYDEGKGLRMTRWEIGRMLMRCR